MGNPACQINKICRYCHKPLKTGKFYCSRACYNAIRPRKYDIHAYKVATNHWHYDMSMIPIYTLPKEMVNCILKLLEVKRKLNLPSLILSSEESKKRMERHHA